MPLTPEEIRDRAFSPAVHGYRRDEVRFFLARVAEDYQTAIRAIADAAVVADAAKERSAARRFAAQLRERAERDAIGMRKKAAAEMEQVRAEAARSASLLDQAVELLRHAHDAQAARSEDMERRMDAMESVLTRARKTLFAPFGAPDRR